MVMDRLNPWKERSRYLAESVPDLSTKQIEFLANNQVEGERQNAAIKRCAPEYSQHHSVPLQWDWRPRRRQLLKQKSLFITYACDAPWTESSWVGWLPVVKSFILSLLSLLKGGRFADGNRNYWDSLWQQKHNTFYWERSRILLPTTLGPCGMRNSQSSLVIAAMLIFNHSASISRLRWDDFHSVRAVLVWYTVADRRCLHVTSHRSSSMPSSPSHHDHESSSCSHFCMG